jgi:hypothetical protein
MLRIIKRPRQIATRRTPALDLLSGMATARTLISEVMGTPEELSEHPS